jgi:citrate lyase beta subunit
MFGAWDLSSDLGSTADWTSLLYARSRLVTAAAAARIVAIDAPYLGIAETDDVLLEAEARSARALGFRGKICIHPRHVACLKSVFSPGTNTIRVAEATIAACADSEIGVVEGKMVGPPHVRTSKKVLARR